MPSLDAIQATLAQVLDHGPAFLPEGLFHGPPNRVVAGLKAHANTISHARLVALEETFPRTRTVMGDERFNLLSRDYLDMLGGTAHLLADIGMNFPAFLEQPKETIAFAGLARFEWVWLTSYHAAEAPPLTLADLAGIDAEALMGIAVVRHPSASIVASTPAVQSALYSEVPGLRTSGAILVTRPEFDVMVTPATQAMTIMFGRIGGLATLGDLIAVVTEDEAMPAMIGLLEAGAVCRAGDPS